MWGIIVVNTFKTLIIIVVILVGVLGVVSGIILKGDIFNSNKNVITNQTNTSTNSSNNTTAQTSKNTTSSNSGFISAQEAISIAKPKIENDSTNGYSAQFVNGHPYGSPHYYAVSAQYKSNSGWVEESTEVDVNAKTGKILATYQSGGTNDPLVPD